MVAGGWLELLGGPGGGWEGVGEYCWSEEVGWEDVSSLPATQQFRGRA